MVLGKLPVPGVLLIWIRVGQGPDALAVAAGVFVSFWTFLLCLSFPFSFSLCLGDGPIQTEIPPLPCSYAYVIRSQRSVATTIAHHIPPLTPNGKK